MATAKKATAKRSTAKATTSPPDPQPTPTNGLPSDQLVAVGFDEFYNVMNQMYPEQTARVVAEIKSAKLEQLVRELRGETQ